MSYCGNCGTLITDGWNFCPRCGKKKRPDICPKCGRELRDGWTFCPACGTGIEERSVSTVLPAETVEERIVPEADAVPEKTEVPAPENIPEELPAPENVPEELPVQENVPKELPAPENAEESLTAAEPVTEFPPEWEELRQEAAETPETDPEPRQSDEEELYAALIARRDALREKMKILDAKAAELNTTDMITAKLPEEERRRIAEERREIRTNQGRCHTQLLQLSAEIRRLADREARRGREIYSHEHPEVACPACSAKLRRGVDTWPLCPFCGEDVTEPGRAQNNTVLLKLRCGENGLKRVWYTGDREFSEYWEAFRARHRRHEYRYSDGRAVLTAEDARSRGEGVVSEIPDELPALHILLHRENAGGGEDSADGMRTVNLGTLDMTDLTEAERFAFLRLLLADRPDKNQRRFKLE